MTQPYAPVTIAAARRGIERFENVLWGMDDGAAEDGLNRCLRRLVEMRIRFVSTGHEGMIDGVFRAACPQPGFERRWVEPVADPEVRI